MAEDQAAPAAGAGRSIRFYLFGLVVIVGAFVAVGYFHLSRNQTVAAAREARGTAVDRGPRVEVVAAAQGPTERTITMLADVRANTPGDHVRQGQRLHEVGSGGPRRPGPGRAGHRRDRVA